MSPLKTISGYVIFCVATGLLLAYSWAEGQWTGRWHPSDVSRLAAEKLKTVPMSIGDWEGADAEFNESQLAIGELDGYLHRIYSHRTTGDQVQILVVCGRAGPVSLHTPDVCYRGLGFTPLSTPTRKTLIAGESGQPEAVCWGADFKKATPFGRDLLRIGWTWLANDRWQAADQPRFEFATEPVLYKAYFIHSLLKEESPWEEDRIPKLAKDLLPMLTEHFNSTAATKDALPDTEMGSAPSSDAD